MNNFSRTGVGYFLFQNVHVGISGTTSFMDYKPLIKIFSDKVLEDIKNS